MPKSSGAMDMALKSGSHADFSEQIATIGKDGRFSVPNCIFNSEDGASITKEDTNKRSLAAEGSYHQQQSHHVYDEQGKQELDELSYFFAGDGLELPFSGVQSDDPSLFFYMPRYGHDNSATLWELDEQFEGQQSFDEQFEGQHLFSFSSDYPKSHIVFASPKQNASTLSCESTLVSNSQNGAVLETPKLNTSCPSPPTLLKTKGHERMEGAVGTIVLDSQKGGASLEAAKLNASGSSPLTRKIKGHKGVKGAVGTHVSNSQNGEAAPGAPKSNASGEVHKRMEGVVGTLVSDSHNGEAEHGAQKSNACSPSSLALLKPKGQKEMERAVGIKCSAQPLNSMSHACITSSSCQNSSYSAQFMKSNKLQVSQQASNFHSADPSNRYYSRRNFSSVSNPRNGGSSQQSGFKSLGPNSLSQVSDGLYQMRENFQKRGKYDSSREFNCGPRANGSRDALGSSSRKTQLCSSIHKDQYNLKDFETEYEQAMFFMIKSFSEDDIHKSIKYNVWASTQTGNKKLDAAFHLAETKSMEKGSHCPIFLFFSVNGSGQFVGLAEMIGQVDFKKNMDFWQYDNLWDGFFPLKWHIIKDIPNYKFLHIILENNENKPVSCSRDTQEIGFSKGLEMLRIFKNYPEKTLLLDDFDFYEAQETLKISNHLLAQSKPNRTISQPKHVEGRKTDASTRSTLQRHTEREAKIEEVPKGTRISKGAEKPLTTLAGLAKNFPDVPTRAALQRHIESETKVAESTKVVNQPFTTLAALAKNFPDDVSTRATLQRHAESETKVAAATTTRKTKVANQPFTTLSALAKNFTIDSPPQKCD